MVMAEHVNKLYESFNARDLEALLDQMTPDVDWPNAWEGGRADGREGVRDYWTRQWAAIDSRVVPTGFTRRDEDTMAVDVHQVVRAMDGTLLGESDVVHVYTFDAGLIARMDIEEP